MLKKLLFTVLAALPLCLAAQTAKFGVFNSQQIFELMPEKATAEKTLNDVGNKYQEEYKKLQDEFEKKYTELQNLAADTPQSIKDRRLQEIQETQTKIQNFEQMAAQDIQKQQQTLMAPISDKINQAVQAVGAEGGYTLLFDLSVPAVTYIGAGAEDVTAKIKAKLGLQ